MTNTLYLPELREMLAAGNAEELREFCTALHPARTAEFMEGLSPEESWKVLAHTDPQTRTDIFSYFETEKQVEILESLDRAKVAGFLGGLPPDDAVDLLNEVRPEVAAEIIPQIPAQDRRIINRLKAYPEETAGAIMTTQFARLGEGMSVDQAIEDIRRQAQELETIYYLYVVDDSDHLRGIVSFRELMSAKRDQIIGNLMETDIVAVDVSDDQEEVAGKVARFDLLAIPVVDESHHLLGIITHDDVMDVVREEALEDAQRIGGVEPLDNSYMRTGILRLTWNRGMWLALLFFGALLTAIALGGYQESVLKFPEWGWLVFFIPLVISSGGNSGSQSATLIISALTTHDVSVGDWMQVVRRELFQGFLLGGGLALIGYFAALAFGVSAAEAVVIPCTLVLVVICGTLCGSTLPLLFHRLGLDPALMSTPLVAGIVDVVGIMIYMNVALLVLR